MAVLDFPGPTIPDLQKNGGAAGAEPLSIESWNTGTDSKTDYEDMPLKSIDIRLTDNSDHQKTGQLRPFPALMRGQVRAEPEMGQGTGSLRVPKAAS